MKVKCPFCDYEREDKSLNVFGNIVTLKELEDHLLEKHYLRDILRFTAECCIVRKKTDLN